MKPSNLLRCLTGRSKDWRKNLQIWRGFGYNANGAKQPCPCHHENENIRIESAVNGWTMPALNKMFQSHTDFDIWEETLFFCRPKRFENLKHLFSYGNLSFVYHLVHRESRTLTTGTPNHGTAKQINPGLWSMGEMSLCKAWWQENWMDRNHQDLMHDMLSKSVSRLCLILWEDLRSSPLPFLQWPCSCAIKSELKCILWLMNDVENEFAFYL